MDMSIQFFIQVTGLAATAVLVLMQILKLNFIPIAFVNRYPVPSLLILSTIAAGITVWLSHPVAPVSWVEWVILVGTTIVVAGIAYNNTIRNWTQLRATEGEGK